MGDTILANHIRAAGSNALYFSPHIQNEIISIIGKLTKNKIVRQVNEAGFFAMLADGTTVYPKPSNSLCAYVTLVPLLRAFGKISSASCLLMTSVRLAWLTH